jgi:hypothetical protein
LFGDTDLVVLDEVLIVFPNSVAGWEVVIVNVADMFVQVGGALGTLAMFAGAIFALLEQDSKHRPMSTPRTIRVGMVRFIGMRSAAAQPKVGATLRPVI